MASDIAVEDLGKRFRRYHANRPRTIKETIIRGLRQTGPVDTFWALRHVSFKVKPGHGLGVIGRNGAGKSTLLRLVGGVGRPDEGQVTIRGRVGALFSLSAGFHAELTGRENIFLGGVVSGLTRQEVAQNFDSIVAFAELEKFIDSPLRTYSSGMRARLGFAVAIHTLPEILLIDEVLAVGDSAFKDKCLEHINGIRAEGRTIILVSHSMNMIQQFCDNVLWLHQGQVMAYGPAEVVTEQYTTATSGPDSSEKDNSVLD